MRFAELMLERYGRFSGCRLDFRAGPPQGASPDLHLIYGANEAGKSTTLDAVSDLLFGFGARTPHGYRFADPLLRVGGVLEEGTQRVACRRRKGRGGTLLDAADAPIGEDALLAMLHGQTRESFHAAFSMDQARLRRGGRAIVDMQDELGKALFAATSGLVGIAGVARMLNAEADAIWGQRASARRSYTNAERALREAEKRIRDSQTRPKDWDDARRRLETKTGELAALQGRRDAVVAGLRRLERLRRTGPAVSRRAALLGELEQHRAVVALSPADEESGLALLAELELAERHGATARHVLAGLQDDLAALAPDAAVLAEADAIDRLSAEAGVIAKATRDRVGVEASLAVERASQADLLAGFGSDTQASLPSRLAVGELRDLAQRSMHADTALRSRQRDLEASQDRGALLRQQIAGAMLTEDLPQITAAVEAARALGAGFDDHCAGQLHRAAQAQAYAAAAIARLAPWSGSIDALAACPGLDDAEIEDAQRRRAEAQERLQAATSEIMRLGRELATLELEAASLSTGGQAVSAAELDGARALRDRHWQEVRGHLLGTAALGDPAATADVFNTAVLAADTLADRRFSLAEASGRLAGIELGRAKLTLSRQHAEAARDLAAADAEAGRRDWSARLLADGLPDLEPARLRAWQALRREALASVEAAQRQAHETAQDIDRRDRMCGRLAAFHEPADRSRLAPLLEHVDRLRQVGEERARAWQTDRTRLRELEDQAADLRRHVASEGAIRDQLAEAWSTRIRSLDLLLPIETALPRLDLYEQLRARNDTIADLQHRLDRIARDTDLFVAEVAAVAGRLDAGADATGANATGPDPLPALVARLSSARATEQRRDTLRRQREARDTEAAQAAAQARAATEALAPLLARTDVAEPAALGGCIERSRHVRALRSELAQCERDILAQGDGHALAELVAAWNGQDPDRIAADARAGEAEQQELNRQVSALAAEQGAARTTFDGYADGTGAADAAADAAQSRAEMDTLAEDYLLRRTQSLMLNWVIETTRRRRQNPLLVRAGALFSTLTLGRYGGLHIEHDEERHKPRLLAIGRDGATMIEVDAMSEGTVDQLFLALRLAAVEQSVAAGVRLPFLADDLFVNFDDDRARAGLQALAELARSTQVLFFTHHAHLVPIARDALGADIVATCELAADG